LMCQTPLCMFSLLWSIPSVWRMVDSK
jgi:hypothetical protein